MFAEFEFGRQLFAQQIHEFEDFGSWQTVCPDTSGWSKVDAGADRWLTGLDHLLTNGTDLLLIHSDGSKLILAGGRTFNDPWSAVAPVVSDWLDIHGKLRVNDGLLLIHPDGSNLVFQHLDDDDDVWTRVPMDFRQIRRCH